jgi:hypothetical protein
MNDRIDNLIIKSLKIVGCCLIFAGVITTPVVFANVDTGGEIKLLG